MATKLLLINIFLLGVLVKHSHGWCMPCPKEGMNLASFTNCECPLGEFYNIDARKCVDYFSCPTPQARNPLPEIKAISPLFYDVLTNALDTLKLPEMRMPQDVDMTVTAFGKRIETIKRNLPGLMGPLVTTIIRKNHDVIEKCKEQPMCILMEALKKKENYNVVLPKITPVLFHVVKQFLMIFDDLEKMAEARKCSYVDGNCPLVKGVTDLRKYMPGLEELSDIPTILATLSKYTLGDVKKYMPFLKFPAFGDK